MLRYLVRRLLISVPTLLGISLLLFVIVSLAPGDPLAELTQNPSIPPEVAQTLRRQYGIDSPLAVRYVKWLGAIARGNWGYSFANHVDVTRLIRLRLPTTLAIIGGGYFIGVALAVPLGLLSALRQYSWLDNVLTTITFFGFSLPSFFAGLLLILVFSLRLHWLPMVYTTTIDAQGLRYFWELIKHAILPVTVIALVEGALLMRYVRSSMLDVIHLDYVRTARAKGLSERSVTVRHALRNGLIPIVTIMALQIPGIFTGSVVTEQIFRVPGIGSMLIDALNTKDTPVLMAIVITYALLVLVFGIAADMLYAVLDPRIRYT